MKIFDDGQATGPIGLCGYRTEAHGLDCGAPAVIHAADSRGFAFYACSTHYQLLADVDDIVDAHEVDVPCLAPDGQRYWVNGDPSHCEFDEGFATETEVAVSQKEPVPA